MLCLLRLGTFLGRSAAESEADCRACYPGSYCPLWAQTSVDLLCPPGWFCPLGSVSGHQPGTVHIIRGQLTLNHSNLFFSQHQVCHSFGEFSVISLFYAYGVLCSMGFILKTKFEGKWAHRYKIRLRTSRGDTAVRSLCWNKSKLVRVSDHNAHRKPPFRHLLGISKWKETLWWTREDILYHIRPGSASGFLWRSWGEGHLKSPTPPSDPILDKWKITAWVKGWFCLCVAKLISYFPNHTPHIPWSWFHTSYTLHFSSHVVQTPSPSKRRVASLSMKWPRTRRL